MTQKETGILERLRAELHGYHLDVMKLTIKLGNTTETVDNIEVDLYGTPGDKAINPGKLKEFSRDITDLKRSRKTMRFGFRGLWVVITMVLSGLIGWLFLIIRG